MRFGSSFFNMQLVRLGIISHNGVQTLRHRTFKGASWALIGAGFSQGLGFLCIIVIARILQPGYFGEFSTIRTSIAMFAVFSGFGLGYTASKHIAEFRDSDPFRASRIWGLVDTTAMVSSFVMSCVLFFMSSLIADKMLKAPQLSIMLKISAITLFFNTMIWVQNFVLGGFEAFKRVAIIEVSRGLMYFPFLIIGSYFWGTIGAVCGLSLVSVGGFIISKIMLIKESHKQSIYIDRHGGLKELGILLKFTLPSLSSSIVTIVSQWACIAMLVRQAGGLAQNGLLNAANQWPEIVAFIPMTLGNPIMSIMSNTYGQSKYAQFKKLVFANIGLIGALIVVISIVMALLAPFLIAAYGESYSPAVILLQIGCATVVFRSISRMTSQTLLAMGKVRSELVFSVLRVIVLLLTWYMLLLHQALGLAIAWFSSFLFLSVVQGTYVLCVIRNLDRK